MVVAVNLAGGRARVGNHHDSGAAVDGSLVRRQEELEQRGLVHLVDALVEQVGAGWAVRRGAAKGRPAIANEVFGCCHRGVVRAQAGTLEALDAGRAELGDAVGVLTEALERAAPADVLGNRDDWPEIPSNPGGIHLESCGGTDLLNERRVVRGTHADVLREDGRAFDVVVPVHGVNAVEDRDAQTGPEGGLLIRVDHLVPSLRGIGIGVSAAAAEDRAEVERGRVQRIDRVLLDLGHLADLLVQGHLAKQRRDAIIPGPACVQPGTA